MSKEEKEYDEVIYEALEATKKAFQAVISDYEYDSAYTDIRFTAWIKDLSFEHRLRKIEIEDEVHEC
jgi:hypothetical protein